MAEVAGTEAAASTAAAAVAAGVAVAGMEAEAAGTVVAAASASQSRGRATVSQRGFPHVAQATVSIRGFPRVLFTGLLRPPAMPEDDGGRPSPPDIGEATCMCVSCMLRAPAHGTSPTSGGNRRTHQSWTTMKKSGTRTRNRSRNRATQLFEFPPRCLEWPPFLLSFCTCQIAAQHL